MADVTLRPDSPHATFRHQSRGSSGPIRATLGARRAHVIRTLRLWEPGLRRGPPIWGVLPEHKGHCVIRVGNRIVGNYLGRGATSRRIGSPRGGQTTARKRPPERAAAYAWCLANSRGGLQGRFGPLPCRSQHREWVARAVVERGFRPGRCPPRPDQETGG